MDWVEIIIGAVSGGALVSLLTIPFAIKKAKAEARAAELDNIQKVADGWEKLCDERQEECDHKETLVREKEQRIDELNGRIDNLYVSVGEWRDKYTAQQEEIASLKVKIATDEVKLCMVRGCANREPQSGY